MNKKSIAQKMKDAGFKPLSRAQQQQNIEALTPVWVEEQNDMTTKTDAAREEILNLFMPRLVNGAPPEEVMRSKLDLILEAHFPPSVPVSKLKALKRHAANVDGGYIESADLDALIAEAK